MCCLVLFSLIFLYQTHLHAGTCTISSDVTQSQSDLETCAGGTLNNLIIDTGATLTLNGAITVSGNVTVNGSITHAAQDINGINITATNFTLSNSATLNVKGKGCPGSNSDGPYLTGYGPDTDSGSGTYKTCVAGVGGSGQGQYGGAGHGGTGGVSYSAEGAIYDSVTTPILLGAGGGGSNSGGSYGGGIVILNISGTSTINGNITSNAGGNGGAQGGGSGGTVYLNTGTLTGTGTMSASGGNGDYYGAGGGGGRIAVYYNTNNGFDLSHITALGGTGYNNGKNGTTYIVDQTQDDLRVTSGLEFSSEGDYTRHSISIDTGANLYCSSLASTLNISSSTNYTDGGSTWNCSTSLSTINFNITGTLDVTGISWTFANADQFNLTANTFTNSGTNSFTMNKAGSQSHWNLSNNLTLNNFTYTGGHAGYSSYQGGVLFINDPIQISLINSTLNTSVSWTGITSLNIDANSSINANAKGCSGSTGTPYLEGFGPNLLDSNYACASGDTPGVAGAGRPQYGGAGHCSAGNGSYGPPSTTYDTATAPFLPGSGGAGGGTYMAIGGGTIRLSISGNLVLNGNLSANAGTANSQGGGSGGSVWINASNVSGNGNVYANGMPGNFYGAPGGAGYIALYYDALDGFSASQLQSNGVSGQTSDCTPYVSLNPNLDISETSITINELGGTGTFTVALKTQPSSDVTVNLVSTHTNFGTVSPASLLFTSSNWSSPQTVTVTSTDTSGDGTDDVFSINLTATSSDTNYDGKSNSVSVTVKDNGGGGGGGSGSPALHITIQAPSAPLEVGSNAQYLITVSNEGNGEAENTILTITLPDSLEFLSAEIQNQNSNLIVSLDTSNGCSATNQLVTCGLGNIAASGSSQVLLLTHIVQAGSLQIEAQVESSNGSSSKGSGGSGIQITSQNLQGGCSLSERTQPNYHLLFMMMTLGFVWMNLRRKISSR